MTSSSVASIVVGQSQGQETGLVVAECVDKALARAPEDFRPGWALAFCGGRHDPDLFVAGLRERLKGIPVVGGAAVGAIGRDGLGYSGYEAIVALFPERFAPVGLLRGNLKDKDEFTLGQDFGARLKAYPENAVVLMFYDSVRSATPVQLHVGSRLLDGIYAGLGEHPLQILGAGTLADFNFNPGYIFDGLGAEPHGGCAVVLPPCLAARTWTFHGCLPASAFMTITRIEGAVVYELDHRPALRVLGEILGRDFSSGPAGQLTLSATVGEKQGDLFAPYDEAFYVNRLILTQDPGEGSITLFEPDFRVGSRVQIMSRSNALMLDSVRNGMQAVSSALAEINPVLGLYIDCAGRSSMVSGAEVEEAGEVSAALAPQLPVIGCYTGVELAPVNGRSRPLDWTGVLAVLHEV